MHNRVISDRKFRAHAEISTRLILRSLPLYSWVAVKKKSSYICIFRYIYVELCATEAWSFVEKNYPEGGGSEVTGRPRSIRTERGERKNGKDDDDDDDDVGRSNLVHIRIYRGARRATPLYIDERYCTVPGYICMDASKCTCAWTCALYALLKPPGHMHNISQRLAEREEVRKWIRVIPWLARTRVFSSYAACAFSA